MFVRTRPTTGRGIATTIAALTLAVGMGALAPEAGAQLGQRVRLDCPPAGEGITLASGNWVLYGACSVQGALDLSGDADLYVNSANLSVAGDVSLRDDARLIVRGGVFRLAQLHTQQYRMETRGRAILHFEDVELSTNGFVQHSPTGFLHAWDDSVLRFIRCNLNTGFSWLLAYLKDRSQLGTIDSFRAPTEVYASDGSTVRISGPGSHHRVVLLLAPGIEGQLDDLPAEAPFTYVFGRGTPDNGNIGYRIEVLNSFVRWGIAASPRSRLALRNNGQPVTISYTFKNSTTDELLSGLRTQGPLTQLLEHQERHLELEQVLLHPVSWQMYVEATLAGRVLVEDVVLNELGVLTDGHVEVRESNFQFAYVSAFLPGSRLRIEDSVINSQSVLAQANGVLEIVESSIWGSRIEGRGSARVRLLNVELEANVCHPGCLPSCMPRPGGDECNGFNVHTQPTFSTSGRGAILGARLAPITAPVAVGTPLAVVGDAFVETLDEALSGWVYQLSFGPADAESLTPLTGELTGNQLDAVLATLDTAGLSPGDYVLRLELSAPGEPPLVAERPFLVEPPPPPTLAALVPAAAPAGAVVTLESVAP